MIRCADIEFALDSCMKAQRPTGIEFALTRDASLLAEIVAPMWYYKRTEIDISELAPEHREAFNRWKKVE